MTTFPALSEAADRQNFGQRSEEAANRLAKQGFSFNVYCFNESGRVVFGAEQTDDRPVIALTEDLFEASTGKRLSVI